MSPAIGDLKGLLSVYASSCLLSRYLQLLFVDSSYFFHLLMLRLDMELYPIFLTSFDVCFGAVI